MPAISFPDPLRVAAGTFLVRPLLRLPGAPVGVHRNSLVILGAEPVLVDTGPTLASEEWCEQVFSLVDPDDVRWVFLSHADHAGNLDTVLDSCPNATLVTSRLGNEAMSTRRLLPARRRWLDDGETLDVGDRQLVAVRPPVFDSATTRGLFDPTTGVYWSSDAFGTPVTDVVDHVDELPGDEWIESFAGLTMMLSPWLHVADGDAFGRWVDRIEELRPTAIVSARGPVLTGDSIGAALARLRLLPARALLATA